jgi:predicted SAM-dependent methyltransferase
MSGSYVQFGCGLCAPAGWRNFDAGPVFWLQKRFPFTKNMLIKRGFPNYPVESIEYANVIWGLPLACESAAVVYSSHVLEHLPLDGMRQSLSNIYAYLQPGGCFRFVLPDLEALIGCYNSDASHEAASLFMKASSLGEKSMQSGIRGMLRSLFGRSAHLWMYDFKAMNAELTNVGFINIRRAQFGDSDDLRFGEVEEAGRWHNCLGIDCKKPL